MKRPPHNIKPPNPRTDELANTDALTHLAISICVWVVASVISVCFIFAQVLGKEMSISFILICVTVGSIIGCFLAFINLINSVEKYINDDIDG